MQMPHDAEEEVQLPDAAGGEAAGAGTQIVGAITVVVSSLAGQTWDLEMAADDRAKDLHQALANAGGPPAMQQRLLCGHRLLGGQDRLGALGTSPQRVSLVLLKLRNLALASSGSEVVGVLAGEEQKPLLRHDDAFPAETWGEDSHDVPEEKCVGSTFIRHLAAADAEWQNDWAQSTFLTTWGDITVKLGGDGGLLTKIGFTFSTWDHNFGRACDVQVSEDGDDFEQVAQIFVKSASTRTRGDASQSSVETLFVEVPDEVATRRQRFVRLSFGSMGNGRRLYFLYVLGYP